MTADPWAAADHIAHSEAEGSPEDWQPTDEELEAREDLDYQAQLDMDVADRVRRLEVEDLARARYAAKKAGPPRPFDAGTLAEILARGPTPQPRVEDLIPADGGTLVVGSRKTGKTTFQLNLARSLVLGTDFLGRFGVRKVAGNIAILNYEVSGSTLGVWADEHQIPDDRLVLVNLRGRTNPFSQPEEQRRLANYLKGHDIETLIVDPFGKAYTGTNQNDPGEVGAWLSQLDQFGRDQVEAADLILAAHAGWVGERTRGSSALEDWADSIITMTRAKDDDQRRFLKAEGRDVLVDEDQLVYDHDTRTLTLAGTGSRRDSAQLQRLERQVDHVRVYLSHTPDQSGNQIDKHLAAIKDTFGFTHSNGDGARTAKLLIDNGEATCVRKGNASRFSLISPDSPELPTGNPETSLTSPIDGEVSKGARKPKPPQTTKETT